MEERFAVGFMDELEKESAKRDIPCPGGRIRSRGKGRGMGFGRGKGPLGVPLGEKTAGVTSIKAKIEAARRDPSTKANPKDTGPKGSGLQDPRVKLQQMLMKAKRK